MAAIVICYNQAPFIRQCLDSVMTQDVPVQLIIVDDASTDGSQQVIQEWVAERAVDTQLILHQTNHGVSRSCNDGAQAVRTAYMGFIAADDYWLPGKLSRQLRLLQRLPPAYGMVYGDAFLCNETGVVQLASCIAHQSRRTSRDRPQGWIFGELMRGNFIPACSVLMRPSAFIEVGGLDESLLVEDLDFWLRFSRRYQVGYDTVPSAVYRIRPGSMVRTREVAIRFEDLKVYRRYLNYEGADRRLAIDALSRGYYRLYAAGAPGGVRFLWLSLRLRIHWQPALLLPFAAVGLNGQRYKRLRGWLNRSFPGLRRLDL
ncbi:MAG: glycosyltransferase [Actinomycetota bacterium]|nr:glycosyltransferase [Actinomycetota bacterium]